MWSIWASALLGALVVLFYWFVRAFGSRRSAGEGGLRYLLLLAGAFVVGILGYLAGWQHGLVALLVTGGSVGVVEAALARQHARVQAAWRRDGLSARYEDYGEAQCSTRVLGAKLYVTIPILLLGDAAGLWLAPRIHASHHAKRLEWGALTVHPPAPAPPQPDTLGVPPTHEMRLDVHLPGARSPGRIVLGLRASNGRAEAIYNELVAAQSRHVSGASCRGTNRRLPPRGP